MDGSTKPRRRDRRSVVAFQVPAGHAVGPPFTGSEITVDWARRDLVHDAHYLLRHRGRATIGLYCQDTDTMRDPARRAPPLNPPFDVVGRIVRLVRPL